jgi:putative transposase
VVRIFKYRLMGSHSNLNKLYSWIHLCRWLYNTALAQRISIYKQNKGRISRYDQMKQLPELKESFIEYKLVDAQTLQDVIERLDRAYNSFFRRLKKGEDKPGYPRFKNKDRYNSFTLKKKGWKLVGKYLIITKIGRFKLKLSRPLKGNIKTVTIRMESNGKWYVYFSCADIIERKLPALDTDIGIDLGIKYFLVDSDNNKIDNPEYLKQSSNLLRVKQRILCRRKKGSNNRRKARVLVTKLHEKIKNQRNDFLHKLSSSYIKNYGTLIFEDLNILNMVKNRRLAKSISDVGWGKFYESCAYKAEEAGRQIIRIPRFEPTSKTCSNCGEINHSLKFSDREWICMDCGVLHDRDYNAAKNIKRVGQTQQALTCASTQSVACKSPRSTKKGSAKRGMESIPGIEYKLMDEQGRAI